MDKKCVLFVGVLLAGTILGWSSAEAGGVRIGIGIPIGGPAYYPPPYYASGYYPYPYYAAPPAVYVQPAPVYGQPAPVYAQPAPVVQQYYYPPPASPPPPPPRPTWAPRDYDP